MVECIVIAFAAALACASVGGGFYELGVVDPVWPSRLELIQPQRGGIVRRRFWIPAHLAFELFLILSLVLSWPASSVRWPLLAGLASHAVMRIWSAFDFIPRALAFEKAEPGTVTEDAARRWTRRSMLRLPLDIATCIAMFLALVHAVQL